MTTPTMIQARQPQNVSGMRVLHLAQIDINLIIPTSKGPYINPRVRGLNTKKIEQHQISINNGQYQPEYYVPPVVEKNTNPDYDGEYLQLTGEHRYQAHLNTGATHFYAAVVEFVDENGKSADYHRDIYMSNENSEFSGEVAQEKRKPEDVVATVVAMVQKKTIPSTDEAISSALSDLGYLKRTNAHKNLMNDVNATLGKGGVVSTIATSELKATEKKLNEENDDVFTTCRVHNKASAFHRDYHPRLISEVIVPRLEPALKGKEIKPIDVMYAFNGLTPSEVEQTRPLLESKRFIDTFYLNTAKPFVDLYEKGIINENVNVDFFNQLKNDKFY